MSQSIEYQLVEEDYQLIESNHLGNPLSVYRLKTIYARFMCVLGLLLLSIGCIPPAITIMIVLLGLYKEQPDGIFYLVMLISLSGFSFLVGLFILRIELPRIRNQHLIVCEQGIIEFRKRGWSKNVKALRWQDILDIRKFIDGYSIRCKDNGVFDLDNMYQNIGILVELIRQRSGRM